MGFHTVGSPMLWAAFLVGVLLMLALDLGVFNRETHRVTVREALTWSVVWVSLSLAFNVAHPAMVRALMLFDTGPGYKNPVGREGWNETARKRAEIFESKGLDALGSSAEVRIAQHRSAQGLAHAARGMLAQFDSRIIESLPEITVPTLVLVGDNDTPFLGGTDYMANKIPNSTKVVIENAGHASNIDQPAAFNAEVRKFLGGL